MGRFNSNLKLLNVVMTMTFSLFTTSALLGQSDEICPATYGNYVLKAGSALSSLGANPNSPRCTVDGNGNSMCSLACFYGPKNGSGTSFSFDIRWTTNLLAQNDVPYGMCVNSPVQRSLPHANRQAVIFYGGDSRPAEADRLAGEILAKVAPRAVACRGTSAGTVPGGSARAAPTCQALADEATLRAVERRSADNELDQLKDNEKKVLDSLTSLARLNEAIKALENSRYVGPGKELANKFKTENNWRKKIAKTFLFVEDADPLNLAKALRSFLNEKVKYYSNAEKLRKELIADQIDSALEEKSARDELRRQGCNNSPVWRQSCDVDGSWVLSGIPSEGDRDYLELDLWSFSPLADNVFNAKRVSDGFADSLSLFGAYGILPFRDDLFEGQIRVTFASECDTAYGKRVLWGSDQRLRVRLRRKGTD